MSSGNFPAIDFLAFTTKQSIKDLDYTDPVVFANLQLEQLPLVEELSLMDCVKIKTLLMKNLLQQSFCVQQHTALLNSFENATKNISTFNQKNNSKCDAETSSE
jgi:hypothetical protein